MRYEGDIYRPPGEWKSYLLQATVGCSNNSCTFCNMYRDKRFHIRPMEDILADIRMAKAYYGDVRRVFLCDGDAIVMRTRDLLTILDTLYATFPSLEKVTTYAGPRSTLTKSPEDLKLLREHGLARAYLGVETGCDALLKQVKKGVNAQQMLEAGLRLREAGISFSFALAQPIRILPIHTDAVSVEQIMDNLTSNAIKYAKGENAKVQLTVQADRHNIVIRFRDNGPGISPKNRKLVFKPFRRTKDASDSRKPGVGLGLALAKDTARSLGGDLKLEFGTLGGASFLLTLPKS